MLITKRFVMLNFPKTGSAFARDTLKRIHQPGRYRKFLERRGLARPAIEERLMMPFFFTETHQQATGLRNSEHGVYVQVPGKDRNKMLVSVMRDPLKRLVSVYEFRSWAKHPVPSLAVAQGWFPHFPELTFSEFFQLTQVLAVPYAQPSGLRTAVGPLTTQFIRFFARDPLKTMLALHDGSDLKKDYDLHFPPVRFLHTENLNQELYELLLEIGYRKRDIEFILTKKKMNTTNRSRPSYLTAEQVEQVHFNERFFYQLFPEYLAKP